MMRWCCSVHLSSSSCFFLRNSTFTAPWRNNKRLMKIIVFDWCLIDNEKRPPTVEYYYFRMSRSKKNLTRYYAQNEQFEKNTHIFKRVRWTTKKKWKRKKFIECWPFVSVLRFEAIKILSNRRFFFIIRFVFYYDNRCFFCWFQKLGFCLWLSHTIYLI